MTWKYFDFYFGNANWPSGALWRVDGVERQLLMDHPLYVGDISAARGVVERWMERTGLTAIEPEMHQDADGRVSVRWWSKVIRQHREREWKASNEVDPRPKVTDEFPYRTEGWRSLNYTREGEQ